MAIDRKIQKYEYISFDIFDTLIYRNVSDISKIFDIVESIYNNKYAGKKIKDFKTNRKKAQYEFYYANRKSLEEVTLEQIYMQLSQYYTLEECNRLKEIEIDTEINMCVTNRCMYKVYKECINKNKKVIICSDMYLPKAVIEKMLQKCGYTSYLELYLSSDINKRKSTGRMFKYVLSKLGINKRSILHIGDNLLSDNIIPRIHGINTYLVKKNKNNNFFNKKVSIEYRSHYNELQNFISNHLDDRKDYFWNMGYETFGPILYGFSFWLKQSIKNDKIFFLSRDGYLMQRAFNLISGNIDSMYLYASRRALIVPTFWMDDTIKEMIDKLYIRDTIKIKNLFRKFGLEDAEFKDAVLSCGYSMNEEIKYADLLACEKFKGLFNKLKPAIHKNSKKEYEVLLKYMKDVNFNGDVSIIDIGWNGNMQLAFSNIVKSSGEKTNITGYYIGVLPESKNLGKINMKAFLFDESNNTDIYLTLKAINSIFESLFLAPHGSVKKMSMKNGKFTPVLLDYEYKDGKEKTAYKNIQDGALKFIEDFNNSYIRNVLNIDARLSFYSMAKFAYNPRNVDVEEFGDFCFLEDDIVFLAKPKSLIFYLFHPKKLLQELYLSGWVIGFMKRLTKINIFYSYLYKKMIRMYLNSRKNN